MQKQNGKPEHLEKRWKANMKIKLYIASHKPTYIPEHPLLIPLQIGTALHEPIPDMLHDDTGPNISEKNPRYCELTGQYWAWKNEQADYYGFYHYRRYFTFQAAKRPYLIYDRPDEATLKRMGYEPKQMAQCISQYDLIVPQAEEMYETVRENYRRAPCHDIADLQLIEQIVKEQCPQYSQAMEQYFQGTKLYLKNMYIMRNGLFQQYCSWLFPLLEEFDCRNDWDKYRGNPVALRVDGYLAERLFGVWYTYQKQTNAVKSCELPRIHFAHLDGGKGKLQSMKLVNAILPPGTRRRSLASRGARFVLKKRAEQKLYGEK